LQGVDQGPGWCCITGPGRLIIDPCDPSLFLDSCQRYVDKGRGAC